MTPRHLNGGWKLGSDFNGKIKKETQRERRALCTPHPVQSSPSPSGSRAQLCGGSTDRGGCGRLEGCTSLEKGRLACSCLAEHPDWGNGIPEGHRLYEYDKEWQKKKGKKKRKKKKEKELWVPDDHLQGHPKAAVLGIWDSHGGTPSPSQQGAVLK